MGEKHINDKIKTEIAHNSDDEEAEWEWYTEKWNIERKQQYYV